MEKLRKEIDDKFKWNLSDLIKNKEEYEELISEVKLLAEKICSMKGQIVLNSDNLYCYLETSDQLEEKLERVYVYSYLYHYQDMQDKDGLEFKNKADKLMEDINLKLSFVQSELMTISYEKVLEFISENEKLKKYLFLLEQVYRYEKYTLSEKEEQIIAEAANAFGTPENVYDNLDNVDIDLGYIKNETGKKVQLTQSNYIKFMNSKDRKVRKQAFKNMYDFYKKFINTISASYLGCIKEGFFSSNIRKFNNPLQQSLYRDNITEDVYVKLIDEVHKYLPLMYKYLKLRNKAFGFKSHMYDIYVDIAETHNEEISFEECKKRITESLIPLGNKYIADLNKAFTDGWIDIYPNKYKRSGAYQWGCYYGHPYVSINFEGNSESVSTLAHELGHAMHSYYSNENQEHTYAGYPIFLAEIASTVNEVLVNDYLYKKAETDEEKIMYLSDFLDKVRTTIFRQTMFAEFEKIMHEKYKEGIAITADELCNTYYELNKLYYGKSIVVDEEIKYEWARIPHFYTPFYVYKYATGLISALSIASSIIDGEEGAKENYLRFLSAGGSDYPLNTLMKTKVDITDSKTIYKAFKMFENKLEELEKLINKKVN